MTTSEQYVYSFGDGHAEGNAKIKNVLGGKGAGLAEMTNIGVPVPPGFTISTAVCTWFYDHGKSYPPELKQQVDENLAAVERDGSVHLGLMQRAVFAFEDFLLSRYHMFLSVYFHYASVGYEVLLQRYCDTSGGEYTLPADIDEYLQHDDVTLTAALRASKNPHPRLIGRIAMRVGEGITGWVAKEVQPVAIARHGNFFLWGFSAQPSDMTLEAQKCFLNAVCYIKKFDGQKPIVAK